ncbi:hypothetical protein IGI04_019215 [Brassica rapa subsp. trilocularis]|uniref:Uncharacterized protein n=1 Tax=Brassica rapa subsp. trilocularis TaxID=1813537 RepID=A0ABQ7MIM4_BRACM|nr:hypothetical protein IGI04_019215 [Brassica rapa subsp. trilocularis]
MLFSQSSRRLKVVWSRADRQLTSRRADPLCCNHISGVADSANLIVGFVKQLSQICDFNRLLECPLDSLTIQWTSYARARGFDRFDFDDDDDDGETTPSETTPREETPREKTPRGAVPPTPLPLVVSPGPSTGPANVDSSREDLALISERETAEPSVTGGKKKRSAPDSSASAASQARTESDGPPKKKKKNERKKKRFVEEQSGPAEGTENCEHVIEKGSSRDAAARGVVDSDNFPSVSLKRKKTGRSHESSTPAKEFKATIDKVAEERAQLLERKKAQKAHFLEKFGELKDKFEAAGTKVRGLEEEKKAWSVGEVARLEDTTVAPALDPIALSTDLVVNEDPLVPVLETGAETGTEPVHLLELSDSSTEEEGGEHLEETEPGLVGNPQNEEGAVDRTDDLPVLPADVTVQVVEGGSNRAED